MSNYQIRIDVSVYDLAQLRAYALKRALNDCNGMTEAEFTNGDHDDPEDNVSYWLGWCFDAGTPPNCGFEIQESETIFEEA
jgi:hypothetical protein